LNTVRKTCLNWSTGKDAAFALYQLLKDDSYQVEHLLTTLSQELDRVSMHGIRSELLMQQFECIGIPFTIIKLPKAIDNKYYEQIMGKELLRLKENDQIGFAAYGDVLLEDLKVYREQHLNKIGYELVLPLWARDTTELIYEMIDLGFKTIVVSVDAQVLDRSFLGRVIDKEFVRDLPKNVDPCGENGEFHTFCFDAPYFKRSIDFKIGEKVLKTYSHNGEDYGFWFCDLLPI